MASEPQVVSIRAAGSGTLDIGEEIPCGAPPTTSFQIMWYIMDHTPLEWGLSVCSGWRCVVDGLIERAWGTLSQYERTMHSRLMLERGQPLPPCARADRQQEGDG